MKTVSERAAFDDCVFGSGSGVEVRVNVSELVEDELRLVAVNGSVAVACFEGVGFNDEESVIIKCGDLSSFPGEDVDIDVSVPLGDDDGFTSFGHE